jgi:hypothetical protein
MTQGVFRLFPALATLLVASGYLVGDYDTVSCAGMTRGVFQLFPVI